MRRHLPRLTPEAVPGSNLNGHLSGMIATEIAHRTGVRRKCRRAIALLAMTLKITVDWPNSSLCSQKCPPAPTGKAGPPCSPPSSHRPVA
jgi:hypothetical protein